MACAVSLRRSRDDSSSASALARASRAPASFSCTSRKAFSRRFNSVSARARSSRPCSARAPPRRWRRAVGRAAARSRRGDWQARRGLTRVSASRARNVSICSRALAMRFCQSSSSARIASKPLLAKPNLALETFKRGLGAGMRRAASRRLGLGGSSAASRPSAASARRPDAIRAMAAARLIERDAGPALALRQGRRAACSGRRLMLGRGDGVARAVELGLRFLATHGAGPWSFGS